ncbi:MAG: acyl-ACP thioesterase [Ruminococcus sp.]|nr:acyl-ACP thioesterase [Ruminococcus sp.]
MHTAIRRVEISDIAENGKMRLSALLDMMQDIDFDHLQSEPALAPYFSSTGNVMFLVSRQADILRLPEYGEELTVSTWCYELKRMYGYRNTTITDKAGNICMQGYEVGAFAELPSQRPVKIEQSVADSVQKQPQLDMEYTPRKIALPDKAPDITAPLKVYSSFIDMYGHVNNARYTELAEDFIPKDREVSRLRAEYKLPLKKEKAQAKVWESESSYIVEIDNAEGKCCCIIEYTFV